MAPAEGRAASTWETSVERHYDEDALGPGYELERLERHSPAELHMTLRALERWAPRSGTAIDIGVGSGIYSAWLASRRLSLHLVDLSTRLLDSTTARLAAAGLGERIAGRHHASATDLRFLPDRCADVVLLLGPLYHLPSLDDRRAAVDEARRLLKPQGLLFAAGVNRMAFLRDAFRESFHRGAAIREICLGVLADGVLAPAIAPPIGHAHVTSAAEFGALFEDGFERLALLGLESFTSPAQQHLASLPEEDREAWLDVVEATASLPDALGYADHFLYVGRCR
jgi:ubiquinone/menaquinone biosynthesis C-methylase UbiE